MRNKLLAMHNQLNIDFATKSPINMEKLNRQNKAVAEHLLSGKRISRYEAQKLYRIGNLHSRISEVKKFFEDIGIKIEKRSITVMDFFNEKTTVREYWLDNETLKNI